MLAAVERVRSAGWSIVQTAAAAGAAWVVSTTVLGYERPFYASISAVICLGITAGQRPRRAVELVAGVTLGIAVADLLVLLIGSGPLQIVVVSALAMTVALALGGGALLVAQAGISAILVVTVEPPTDGLVLDRIVHVLVGGGVALLIGQILIPLDPLAQVGRIARSAFRELGTVLVSVANALGAGDLERARQALLDARALDAAVRRLHEALAVGQETARFAPLRRGARDRLAGQADAAAQVDLAVRNTRVLARAAVALLRRHRSVLRELSAAVAD